MSKLPIGYLIHVLFLACCTYFAVAPLHWPRFLRPLDTYFETINEIPFLALFWLIGSTSLAFSEGNITHPIGKLAFGLALLTASGLLASIYWGLQAAPTVNQALDAELEKGWRTSLTGEMKKQLQKKFSAKALLGPFFRRRFDVQRIANIRYGDAGERNLLDIYRPRTPSSNCPVLIHLHGGYFVRGRKNRQSLPLLYGLASKGWICISANYRLGVEGQFPNHLIDVKKVIAWVREHGEEYGADPAALFLAGNSAGAHIAAMAALTPNNPRFQPGFEDIDTTLTAVICQGGYYGSIAKKIAIPSSPMAYSSAQAPPFFVVHGNRDSVVPVKQARHFVNHLRHTAARPVVYVELPQAKHTIDFFHSLRSEALFHGIQAFATWVLKNQESLSKDC